MLRVFHRIGSLSPQPVENPCGKPFRRFQNALRQAPPKNRRNIKKSQKGIDTRYRARHSLFVHFRTGAVSRGVLSGRRPEPCQRNFSRKVPLDSSKAFLKRTLGFSNRGYVRTKSPSENSNPLFKKVFAGSRGAFFKKHPLRVLASLTCRRR